MIPAKLLIFRKNDFPHIRAYDGWVSRILYNAEAALRSIAPWIRPYPYSR
jgi:hypothetical protein